MQDAIENCEERHRSNYLKTAANSKQLLQPCYNHVVLLSTMLQPCGASAYNATTMWCFYLQCYNHVVLLPLFQKSGELVSKNWTVEKTTA
jgi:hypothetical protein